MKLSFEHVFVSPKNNSKVFERALEIKDSLQKGQDWTISGDPFMLDKSYADVTLPEIARLFGSDFAGRLATHEAKDGAFSDPIGSAYGVHLVRITNQSPPQENAYEDVKPQVLEAYKSQQRERANQQAVEEIIQKYEIVFVETND